MTPFSRSFFAPATEQHDAGSAPMPEASTHALASMISCSLTCSTVPPLSSMPRRLFFHDTGLPMRTAVAIVSGFATGSASAEGSHDPRHEASGLPEDGGDGDVVTNENSGPYAVKTYRALSARILNMS